VKVFSLKESATATYTATLQDETGAAIPLAELATLKLTFYDAEQGEPSVATGNILNSRNAQDVKNTNNVTVHATSGLVTWSLQTADNPIKNANLATELHVARFDFTYGTPTKTGRHEVGFRVRNLRKVT